LINANAFITANPGGFDQKRARIFKNGLTVFE